MQCEWILISSNKHWKVPNRNRNRRNEEKESVAFFVVEKEREEKSANKIKWILIHWIVPHLSFSIQPYGLRGAHAYDSRADTPFSFLEKNNYCIFIFILKIVISIDQKIKYNFNLILYFIFGFNLCVWLVSNFKLRGSFDIKGSSNLTFI
jgi:hypothetical protein